jgi:hypothetical protein
MNRAILGATLAGLQDKDEGKPMALDSVFRLSTCTKMSAVLTAARWRTFSTSTCSSR